MHLCPQVRTDIPTIFQRGEELMKREMPCHLSFRDKSLQYILHVPPKVLDGIKSHLPAVERTSKIQHLLTPLLHIFHSSFLGSCCKLTTCAWVLIVSSVYREIQNRTNSLLLSSVVSVYFYLSFKTTQISSQNSLTWLLHSDLDISFIIIL